jgi:prepilin-type N-terminal cleavage/methylation domain-containing protein
MRMFQDSDWSVAPGQQSVASGPSSAFRFHASGLRSRCAFTLIELLVVIAIIAILIGILWTAVNSALADAKSKTARSEMREIVSAVTAYFQEYENLPVPDADQGVGDKSYATNTAAFIYQVLTADPSLPANNPRSRVFLNREFTATETYLRDPWNNSYILYMDNNYDNSVSTPAGGKSGRIAVRSYGPDKVADANMNYSTSNDLLEY